MALSPPPPQPDDFLLAALYEAFDGDNWLNNDGWLDPDIHWCDWYGVTCGEEFSPGFFRLAGVELSGNRLRGQFSEEIEDYFRSNILLPDEILDLSDNSITGGLQILPASTRTIDLSANQLSGPLPQPPFIPIIPGGGPIPFEVKRLDLSDNRFSGPISGWPRAGDGILQLEFLDLSNNQLEGSILRAIRAMRSENLPGGVRPDRGLWLADNAFSGEIDPTWFDTLDLDGLNLCWTDLEISDPELDAWIAERHWGGDPHLCLGREGLALDPTISGSWYDIHRPGEGLSILLLEDGTPLVYWFSHIARNRQLWLFNSGRSNTATMHLQPLLRTRGEFGAGFGSAEFPLFRSGGLRLDRVGSDRLHAEFLVGYTGYDLPSEIQITWPPIPATAFRSDHYQLTRLAGSTCDNGHPMQWVSGAWYNPERSGEGFVVEVNEDGRGIVYWFSYLPAGTNDHLLLAAAGDWQVWMTGDAFFSGQQLIIDPLLRPRDTTGEMPGNISGVENQAFGRLTLTFEDEISARIEFTSDDPEFASLDYRIERLARPMLADCD